MTNAEPTTQFTTRDLPWMKLGTVIDKPVKSKEAMKLAGLDFTVERAPLSFEVGDRLYPLPGRSALVDPKTAKHYGVVADGYEVVQYREAFEFIDTIDTNIVAAGALKGGRQAFMVVKAPEYEHLEALADDPHDLYVILRTSHDGSKAIEISIMPLRGMCMNQMPMASFGTRARQKWSIRHVKTARQQLAEAHNVLTGLESYSKAYASTADLLASMRLSESDARDLLEVVLPDRPRRDETIGTLIGMFTESETVAHTNTGWGLVNAIGEYFEHGRRGNSTPESRMINALSGVTTKMINRTAQLLLRRGAQ